MLSLVEIGQRIEAARNAQRINRAELARRVGVDVSTVWRWEHGKTLPLRRLDDIAHALGTTAAALIGDDQ